MDRRSFLKGVVASTLAADGGGWHIHLSGQSDADAVEVEPWKSWRSDPHGPLRLVHAAILSANAYNSQPWMFHVTSAAIEIFADRARSVGAFDPYLRELHFSLGCALENLILTARADGYRPSVHFEPGELVLNVGDTKPALVARVTLAKSKPEPTSLFHAIPRRHTNRDRLDPSRPLPSDLAAAIRRLPQPDDPVRIFLFTDRNRIDRIAAHIVDDSTELLSDPDVQRDTRRWFRTREQMRVARDGTLTEAAAGAEPRPSYFELMTSASLFGLIAVRNRYDREQTIRAGRIWQRAHLLATSRGVAARPANGSIELIDHQRRTERAPASFERLRALTGEASWQPTFMFYMGHATVNATESPRRPVSAVLV